MNLSNREYEKLMQRLYFCDETRNKLLTFSFTAVWAILAIFIVNSSISAWGCLIPYLLIIPFTARIAYYRLVSAHINSFLEKFDSDDMHFEHGLFVAPEKCGCVLYELIAWLVNHEMTLLSLVTSVTFYWRYFSTIETSNFCSAVDFLALIIPFALFIVDFIISDSTYNYKKMMDRYTERWNFYEQLCTDDQNVEV